MADNSDGAMNFNYRLAEVGIPTDKFVRALVTLLVQQLNQLRAFHNLTPLTRDQVIAAVKDIIKNS